MGGSRGSFQHAKKRWFAKKLEGKIPEPVKRKGAGCDGDK